MRAWNRARRGWSGAQARRRRTHARAQSAGPGRSARHFRRRGRVRDRGSRRRGARRRGCSGSRAARRLHHICRSACRRSARALSDRLPDRVAPLTRARARRHPRRARSRTVARSRLAPGRGKRRCSRASSRCRRARDPRRNGDVRGRGRDRHGPMNGFLRSAVAATAFLTRVPIGSFVPVAASDVARGVWLFPLVGATVGGAAGVSADLAATRLPPLAGGAIAVAVAALLTGAMHLDGLADAADALGGTTRERALEIMREPAIGAFGVTAIVSVLLLDATLFGTLAAGGDAAPAGIAAGAAGRAALLLPAVVLPYARSQPGQGRVVEGVGAPL